MADTVVPSGSIPSIDPATGQTLRYFEKTSPGLLPQIVTNARRAQTDWTRVPLQERCVFLRRLADKILSSREILANAAVAESGKPKVEALFADVFVSLDTAEYFGKFGAGMLQPERVPHHSLAAKAKSGRLSYEPLGVLGIISSWNYPLAIPLSQIIPAVLAGNAVVCKTSDFTPQCGELIGKLFVDGGFPRNLVQIVQGGAEVGQALIDAGPDKIFFTGSVATGRKIAEACARKLIPTVLELGGKDAMIVLADANVEATSSGALWGSFTNCGQVCLSVERLFVEETISDSFIGRCVEKTKKLRVGPGNDPATDVGPLIRPQHVQRMLELIEDAVHKGSRVLCGGNARADLGPSFFEPTVISNVNSSMKLFQEETFGPIMAIQTVRNAEEAIAIANDSQFTLAASVWTGNSKRGEEVASRLRAGSVMVNDVISYFAIAEAPHGGCMASGWGRTHGKAGLLEMVQPRYVDVDRMPTREKPWWYRYGAPLDRAANAFLQFQFNRGLSARIRYAREAAKTLFRDHGL